MRKTQLKALGIAAAVLSLSALGYSVWHEIGRSQANAKQRAYHDGEYKYDTAITSAAPAAAQPTDTQGAVADDKSCCAMKDKDREELAHKIHYNIEHDPWISINECKKLLVADAKDEFAQMHMAVAYMMLGHYDHALFYGLQLVRDHDSSYNRCVVGQILYRQGKFREALVQYQLALGKDPHDLMAKDAIARIQAILFPPATRPVTARL